MRTTTQTGWIVIVGLALSTFACEEKASTSTEQAEPTEVAQKPAPKAEVKPASVKQEAAPAVDTSWQLTDARRAAIESSVAAAKGFLDAQEQLATAKPADAAAALKALDSSAKGKWLLVVGTVSKVSDSGIEISLSSSESAAPAAAAPAAAAPAAAPAGDKVAAEGSKPSTVAINVTKIDGFKKDAYQVDQKVAVLAQYTGAGQAQPAYDVVAMGKWQETAAGAAQPGAAQPTSAQPGSAQPASAQQGAAPAAPAPATKPESK